LNPNDLFDLFFEVLDFFDKQERRKDDFFKIISRCDFVSLSYLTTNYSLVKFIIEINKLQEKSTKELPDITEEIIIFEY
jgi:hypothetical protein